MIDRMRARRAAYEAAGCHYWVFENPMAPGDFTEFAEAVDPTVLARAHALVTDPLPGATHIMNEVELS